MQEYCIKFFKETNALDICKNCLTEAILTNIQNIFLRRNKNKTRSLLYHSVHQGFFTTVKFIIMATSLETNTVLVTRVHCIKKVDCTYTNWDLCLGKYTEIAIK